MVFLPCNRDKKYPETSNQSFVFLKFSEWNFPNPAQDIPRTFPDVKAFDVEQQQYLGVDENSHGGLGDMSSTSSFFLLVGGCGVSLATKKWGSQFWEFLVDMMWDRYWRRLFFIWSFIQQDCPQYLAASRSSAKSEILDCLDGHCDEFPTTFGLFRKMALLQSEFSVKLSTIHSAKFTSQDELLKNLRRIGSSGDDFSISPPEVAPAVRPSKMMAGSQAFPFGIWPIFRGKLLNFQGVVLC